jgi:hypothetical protein
MIPIAAKAAPTDSVTSENRISGINEPHSPFLVAAMLRYALQVDLIIKLLATKRIVFK